MILYEVQIP